MWSAEIVSASKDAQFAKVVFRFAHTDGRSLEIAEERVSAPTPEFLKGYCRDKVAQLERDDAQKGVLAGFDPNASIGAVDFKPPVPPEPTPEEVALREKTRLVVAEINEAGKCNRLVEMGLLAKDSQRVLDAQAALVLRYSKDPELVEQFLGGR